MSEEHESTERYIRILETRIIDLEAALGEIRQAVQEARVILEPHDCTAAEPKAVEK